MRIDGGEGGAVTGTTGEAVTDGGGEDTTKKHQVGRKIVEERKILLWFLIFFPNFLPQLSCSFYPENHVEKF